MQIQHVLIKVDDQDKALNFYTSVLGFVKKLDIPMGSHRWLTVTPSEGHEDIELVLESNHQSPARLAQKALYDAGFPAAIFTTKNIDETYQRLKGLGVTFRGEPTDMGMIKSVFFEDTCGNLISLTEVST